jgi:hypothetical protein
MWLSDLFASGALYSALRLLSGRRSGFVGTAPLGSRCQVAERGDESRAEGPRVAGLVFNADRAQLPCHPFSVVVSFLQRLQLAPRLLWACYIMSQLALAGMGASPARGGVMPQPLWGADTGVGELAQIGNTLYLAGGFSVIGPNCGGGLPLDPLAGAPRQPYAKVAGVVYASVSDGAGGWFIGGDFSAVGEQPRRNLAHVLSDGSIAPWQADADGYVRALGLANDTLYVGGEFTHVSGQQRDHLAAITAVCGGLTNWHPDVSGIASAFCSVNAILPSGRTIYVGGDFTTVGGVGRRCLAAVDAGTGRPLDFAPEPAGGMVKALVGTDSTLYVGGTFRTMGGQPKQLLAAVDAATGSVRAWDPHVSSVYYDYDVDPCVSALAIAGDRLYVAGHFTRAGGEMRGGIASLDLSTGGVSDWNPNPIVERNLVRAPVVEALAVHGNVAYVGGYTALGPQQRQNLAAIDLTTGVLTAFDARVVGDVYTLSVDDKCVYAGGQFRTAWNWHLRNGLAAIDMRTGELLPWNPDPGGGFVMAIAADTGAVYIGGRFSQVNGELRDNLAALDPVTGTLMAWNPGADDAVLTLAVTGDRVYAGGFFQNIDGVPRRWLVAVDRMTGRADDWNPDANSLVLAILPIGPSVFIGGGFSTVGGQLRTGIAELDQVSGAATPWNPSADGVVMALAASEQAIYAGGQFQQIGGVPRRALAALDRTTGAATGWNPDPVALPYVTAPRVYSLIAADGVIYASGDFGRIGGADHLLVAAIDTASGEALKWDPTAFNGPMTSLLEHEGVIYMAGGMTRVGNSPVAGLGAWPAVPQEAHVTPELALGTCFPNPSSTSTTVSFVLPVAAQATLSIFDLQGRRVATPMKDQQRPAGPQSVEIHVGGWPIGCYVCRLVVGGRSATRKMLVVK